MSLVWNSKRLLVIEIIPIQEIIERTEGVNTLDRAGEENVDAVVKKPGAELERVIPTLRRDVIDCFEEIDVAPERRERCGTEIRDTRDVHGGSDFVVDGRSRRLLVYWTRASFSERELSVVTLLTTTV